MKPFQCWHETVRKPGVGWEPQVISEGVYCERSGDRGRQNPSCGGRKLPVAIWVPLLLCAYLFAKFLKEGPCYGTYGLGILKQHQDWQAFSLHSVKNPGTEFSS